MAGSRPPTAIRTGSVDSDPWWGTKEAVAIRRAAEQFRAVRNFAAAEAEDQRGLELARRRHDDRAAFVYLASLGAVRLEQSKHRSALEALLAARDLAERSNDPAELGAISVNLSSLYLQIWDTGSAQRIAEEGLARARWLPKAYFRLPLLLQLGRVHQTLGDGRAGEFYLRAIEEARVAGNTAQEARGWDLLGEERLRARELVAADADFTEAFRLRVLEDRADLAFSYARLGAVKLAENDRKTSEDDRKQRALGEAGRFTDRALEMSGRGGMSLPVYLLRHQRGRIRLALGDTRGALRDFSAALDQAERWRGEVLPARDSLIAANIELEKRIFNSFIETAASEALRTGDARLTAESFQAAERNRAASLLESLDFRGAWRERLGPDYREALGQLRVAEAALARGEARGGEAAARLKLTIAEMEATAGAYFPDNRSENFRSQTSLIDFRRGLGKGTLLLSVHVGDQESYLWTVTNQTLSLRRLPGASEIRVEVARFREAIRSGVSRSELRGLPQKAGASDTTVGEAARGEERSEHIGERLYAELFGGLSREEANKREWLLSLDDALFELPFAALLTERKGGKVTYLIEEHSVQVVPGALFLARSWTQQQDRGPGGWFLGLGDPIYNRADSRWAGSAAAARPALTGWFAYAGAGAKGPRKGQLSRLVGSASEVESSARSWTGRSLSTGTASTGTAGNGSTTATVLEGASARRDRFLEMAARRPAIVHLATHILTPALFEPGGRKDEGLIAFGLGSAGEVEVLSTSEIGMLDVAGAVVAMTGCASGGGDIRAGAGLLGLTRAWQLAGARAVVATAWPVEDTAGELFGAFYRHLRSAPAPEALRRSQLEMLRSGTWRSAPGYWAAYQVTGGARP